MFTLGDGLPRNGGALTNADTVAALIPENGLGKVVVSYLNGPIDANNTTILEIDNVHQLANGPPPILVASLGKDYGKGVNDNLSIHSVVLAPIDGYGERHGRRTMERIDGAVSKTNGIISAHLTLGQYRWLDGGKGPWVECRPNQ